MRTIIAQPLSKDAFAPYGNFYDLLAPKGLGLGDFYPDRLQLPVATNQPVGFSPLIAHRPERYIVDTAEYHNYSGEFILPLNGSVIVHVAPPSNAKVPELTKAFIVPCGTGVRLHTGVWHYAPLAIDRDIVNVLIGLPIRTYMTDACVLHYDETEQIEILLK